MVRIFRDKSSEEFVLQTSCLDTDSFISELSEALNEAISTNKTDGELISLGVLTNAMPIAFKLAGYKAETVREQRTLVCGNISPDACEVIATAGK